MLTLELTYLVPCNQKNLNPKIVLFITFFIKLFRPNQELFLNGSLLRLNVNKKCFTVKKGPTSYIRLPLGAKMLSLRCKVIFLEKSPQKIALAMETITEQFHIRGAHISR